MDKDALAELIRAADREAGPPGVMPGLAALVRQRAVRSSRFKASSAAVAALLVFALGSAWLFLPPVAPRDGLEIVGVRSPSEVKREIANIRDMNEVFSHGNFPYLMVASIARRLLEGGGMSGARAAPVFEGRHAPEAGVPFLLMEAHHADAPTRALYDDIKTVLGLPFVNTDYRAFARWPSYFHRAWAD